MRDGVWAGNPAPGSSPAPSKFGNQAAVWSDYKHDALGLIILKLIPHTFEAKHAERLADHPEGTEDPDEYAPEKMFRVPRGVQRLPCSIS
jgi:hypothetical protein